MQSELKPCPFCGGAAECDSRQAFRAMSSGEIRDRFAIYCTSCDADMGFCYDDIESCNHDAAVDQTIAAWNTRAGDAEITRLTEALRDAEEREKALRDALGEYACHAGPNAPCVRSKEQCLTECGKVAGDAIIQALAGAKP